MPDLNVREWVRTATPERLRAALLNVVDLVEEGPDGAPPDGSLVIVECDATDRHSAVVVAAIRADEADGRSPAGGDWYPVDGDQETPSTGGDMQGADEVPGDRPRVSRDGHWAHTVALRGAIARAGWTQASGA